MCTALGTVKEKHRDGWLGICSSGRLVDRLRSSCSKPSPQNERPLRNSAKSVACCWLTRRKGHDERTCHESDCARGWMGAPAVHLAGRTDRRNNSTGTHGTS